MDIRARLSSILQDNVMLGTVMNTTFRYGIDMRSWLRSKHARSTCTPIRYNTKLASRFRMMGTIPEFLTILAASQVKYGTGFG